MDQWSTEQLFIGARHPGGARNHERHWSGALQCGGHGRRGPVSCGIASNACRAALVKSPLTKPTNSLLALITRWQGAMIEIGFRPLAAPTACTAVDLPSRRAISLQVPVSAPLADKRCKLRKVENRPSAQYA